MTRSTTEHTLDLTIGDTVIVTARVEVEWPHDPGCWRTANGDGWPPSSDPYLKSWTYNTKQVDSALADAIIDAINDGKCDD